MSSSWLLAGAVGNAVLAASAVLWLLFHRRTPRFCAAMMVVELEIFDMGTAANPGQYVFLLNVGIVRRSGVVTPVAKENLLVETQGPVVAIPIPEWAPSGALWAGKVTDRGSAMVAVSTPLAPDLARLEFWLDVDDPDVLLTGNIVIMDEPA